MNCPEHESALLLRVILVDSRNCAESFKVNYPLDSNTLHQDRY